MLGCHNIHHCFKRLAISNARNELGLGFVGNQHINAIEGRIFQRQFRGCRSRVQNGNDSSLLADAQNVSNGRDGNLLLKNDYTTRTGNGDGIELEWKISISSTSWLENWAFAPPTTMIEFSPVASIQILAVPVEAEGRI